jgi:type IV pilus assembly protein PilB
MGADGTPSGGRLPSRARLGDLLVADGLLTAEQLAQALVAQRQPREKLGEALVRLGLVSDEQVAVGLAGQFGIAYLSPGSLEPDPEALALVQAAVAQRYGVLPVRCRDRTLLLATADPTDVQALADIGFMTGREVAPVVAGARALREAIARCYRLPAPALAELFAAAEAAAPSAEPIGADEGWARPDVIEVRDSIDDAPVVRLVNLILADAVARGASDIHLEPYERAFRVRFRIDGTLAEIMAPPKRLEAALTSRVKIMANLDIAERRLPQDGRIKLRSHGREVDLRVSTLPTIFGEKTVMRILDREALQLDLGRLGFEPAGLAHFTRALAQPSGMILITGPTGSGKTTTLYSAIHRLNAPTLNIMTAEDPVEYNLRGVNQLQVNEGIGRTFAGALRAFLRQDPDVILVGETRDLETAQIGIRAALTGHLVLSTLHTSDCPSTVARLVDMGVPPFLVASALSLVVAQRLARTVCPACVEHASAHEESLAAHGHGVEGRGRVELARGRGCPACNHTGFRGRVAIYEVMPLNEELRALVVRNAPANEIRALASQQGVKNLRQAGLLKVLDGLTTVEEVLRVTPS